MLKTAPDPIDVQDFQFKLRCKIDIFENENSNVFGKNCNLIAAASRFGLIFVGTLKNSIKVIQTKSLHNLTKDDHGDYPFREFNLPSQVNSISINCEETILAVNVEKENCPWVIFYDVTSFLQQTVVKLEEIRLSATPGVYLTELNWNPTLGSIFTACKSDGSLGLYELKNPGISINELPAAANATCFCWSPKGKQISVGSRDGKITQYKPDLKAVKVINAPPLSEPHSVISLQWVSNYQFIAVFQPLNPENPASVLVVDAPKTGEPNYINYDDICYSNGNTRPVQFYMNMLQPWNILIVASSNSMEVGVLGFTGDSWSQWIMGDASRAELPLTAKHQESLPIGLAIDTSSTKTIPWGEGSLPAAPVLLLLSNYGTLCCFNIINLKEGIPSICAPPDPAAEINNPQLFTLKPSKSVPVVTPVNTSMKPPEQQQTPKINKNVSFSNSSGLPTMSITGFGQTASQSKTQENIVSSTPFNMTPPSQPASLNLSSEPKQKLFNNPIASNTVVSTPQSQSFQPSRIINTPPTIGTTKPILESTTENFQTKVADVEPHLDSTVVDAEAEKLFQQMMREEFIFLEAEVRGMLKHGNTSKINLGTDADKMGIVQMTEALDEFLVEVVDICSGQNAEVHGLKQTLLQSWAWYEEAKSRYLASKDPTLAILQRAQPLDSASEKQLQDIRQSSYYLESQLTQAHRALDEQWENFQDYCKKSHKIKMPTMEAIFQAMVKQNGIVLRQSYVLKDIANRIKSKARTPLGPSFLLSIDDPKELSEEFKRLRLEPEDIYQIQYEHVLNRTKSLSNKKVDALRSFLKKREIPNIEATKLQLSTSKICSPASKLKQLSLLGAKMSPIAKPQESISSMLRSKQTAPPNTPIGGAEKLTFKFEDQNYFIKDKGFLPVAPSTPINAKTIIPSGPNSAFVSTSMSASSNLPTQTVKTTGTTNIFATSKSVQSLNFNNQAEETMKPGFSFASPKTTAASLFSSTTLAATTTTSKPLNFSFSEVKDGTISTPLQVKVPTTSIFIVEGSQAKLTNNTIKPQNFITTSIFTSTTPNITNKLSAPGMVNIVKQPEAGTLKSSPTITTSSPVVPSNIFGGNMKSPTVPTNASLPLKTPLAAQPSSTIKVPTDKDLSQAVPEIVTTGALKSPFSFAPVPSTISVPSLPTSEVSIFAKNPVMSTTSNTPSIFSSTTSPIVANITSKTSIFPAVSQTNPNSSASPTANTVLNKPLFGNAATPIFGGAKPTAQTSSETPAATTANSIFGTSVTSSTSIFSVKTTGSIFGSSTIFTPTTAQMTFGSKSINSATTPITNSAASAVAPIITATSTTTTVTTATTSIFGSAATSVFSPSSTPKTTASVFASNTTASSIFGSTPSVTSTTPLFGSTTVASTTSVFGAASSNLPATTSIFGSTASPIFRGGTTTTTPAFGSGTTTTSPAFGSGTTTTTPAFGSGTTTTTPAFGSGSTTTATSIFGAAIPTTSASIFGAATQTSAAPNSSIFGSPDTTTTSTTASIFGSSNAKSLFGTGSVFGTSPNATTASDTSVFGSATSKPSIFGGATSPPQTTSIFGSTNSPATTSVFGGPSNSPTIFGNANSTPSTQFGNTAFGTPTTASTPFNQQPSVFGSTPTFGSTFGSAANTFGTAATTKSFSFGQNSGSIFGGGSSSTTSGSIFGGTPTTSNAFGGSTSVFGTSTSTSASPFGSTPASNVFASTTSQPSSFSFASNTAPGGSFGFGGLNVGSTPATTSTFGQTTTPTNPFGLNTSQEQKSVFGGGDSKSIFGGSSTTTVFGASNSGSAFGNTPTTGGFGSSPVFGSGQQQSFGQQSSAFGQSTFGNSTFGSPQPGPFSTGGAGTISQSGFGGAASFQSPGGFGAAPAFGSVSPTFGAAPSFGGAPTFGSTATFGSPSRIFGSGSTAFGAAPSTQNPSFGNLANQPTVGFGNLAQQAANAPASNPSFSGSSSFSGWRS